MLLLAVAVVHLSARLLPFVGYESLYLNHKSHLLISVIIIWSGRHISTRVNLTQGTSAHRNKNASTRQSILKLNYYYTCSTWTACLLGLLWRLIVQSLGVFCEHFCSRGMSEEQEKWGWSSGIMITSWKSKMAATMAANLKKTLTSL